MCLGIPGLIEQIVDRNNHIGLVNVNGVKRKVNLACVCNDRPLDDLVNSWVLLHVGFAMSIIDETEAKKTLTILEQMGELDAELQEISLSEQSI